MESKDLEFLGHPGYQITEYGWVINPRGRQLRGSINRQIRLGETWYNLEWLVAKAFVPNPYGWMYVLFKNGDTSNLHYTNLEWSPRKVQGKKQAWILRMLREGMPVKEIAKTLKCSQVYIRKIATQRYEDLKQAQEFLESKDS